MVTGITRFALLGIVISTLAFPSGALALSRPENGAAVALAAGEVGSIAAWLRQSGRDGFLAADVADALGIKRERREEALEAKQRGFRTGDVLRIAQVPADSRRNFLLFVVQHREGEVYFYLATVREGLKKAFISIPSRGMVVPLEQDEAQHGFQDELAYWQDRMASP
jgi:hypothetical protein